MTHAERAANFFVFTNDCSEDRQDFEAAFQEVIRSTGQLETLLSYIVFDDASVLFFFNSGEQLQMMDTTEEEASEDLLKWAEDNDKIDEVAQALIEWFNTNHNQ